MAAESKRARIDLLNSHRRAMVAAALSRLTKPATAAEVLDAVVGLAEAENVPTGGLNTQSVAAFLIQLEAEAIAVRGMPRRGKKRGRPDLTWQRAPGVSNLMPPGGLVELLEPKTAEAPATVDVFAHYTPEDIADYTPAQICAVLSVQEEMTAVVGEHIKQQEAFIRRIEELARAGKRRLAELGVE